jgi:hypothetical protein
VDNTEPTAVFTGFAWREAGTMPWNPLPLTCPVVPRPTGHDIEFQVSYQAAATHLRSLHLTGGGCGGGTPVRTSAANTAEHWYTGPLDNNVT